MNCGIGINWYTCRSAG